MSFEWVSRGKYKYLVYKPWAVNGFTHGFLGRSADFSSANLAQESGLYCQTFGARSLFLPKQVHGNFIVELDHKSLRSELMCIDSPIFQATIEADALILPSELTRAGISFAVRSADCVPLIMRGKSYLALVHSGWRGLANGLIERVLSSFESRSDQLESVVIGPCAGYDSYQVGIDVVEQMGDWAVFRPGAEKNKFYLALAGSAAGLIKLRAGVESAIAPFCTIASKEFYSYRRDGVPVGSNLAFVY